MKNEKHNTERTGKDRWLVSYADFITLLFAFFVVMYSISSINDEKYRTFSNSLEKVFPDSFKNFSSTNPDQLARIVSFFEDNKNTNPTYIKRDAINGDGSFQDVELMLHMKQQFNELIENKIIRIKESVDWLELEVGSNILFKTGSSFLNSEAELIIEKIAAVLKNKKHTIMIEGFTDNVPIHNSIYPSNWELSADRAAAVANEFIVAGIDSARLSITGYGENFPVADNSTARGRQQNRRIVIVVEMENKRKEYLKSAGFADK